MESWKPTIIIPKFLATIYIEAYAYVIPLFKEKSMVEQENGYISSTKWLKLYNVLAQADVEKECYIAKL